MTDLAEGRRAGKRERLVDSARTLFHHRGVERTALADIATAAAVPVGNVYYYFKTKDEIVRAVIDSHVEQTLMCLSSMDRHRSPRARLSAFVREIAKTAPETARYGCPLGTLCSELDRRGDEIADAASALMRIRVDWAREQFQLMGRRDAKTLAHTFIAQIQGAAVLANSFRDPTILTAQTRHIQRWINDLS